MRRFFQRIVILIGVFYLGIPIMSYANDDPLSGAEWRLRERSLIRLFMEGYFLGNEPVKIMPTARGGRTTHIEGLALQARPFTSSRIDALNIFGRVDFATHWDVPDRVRMDVALLYPLIVPILGDLRFELGHEWQTNLGSSSIPSHGIDYTWIGIGKLVAGSSARDKDIFHASAFARYFLTSDFPLAHLKIIDTDSTERSPIARSEFGFDAQWNVAPSWLALWAEPKVRFDGSFGTYALAPEAGLRFPLNRHYQFELGFRYREPSCRLCRSEEAGWFGVMIKF